MRRALEALLRLRGVERDRAQLRRAHAAAAVRAALADARARALREQEGSEALREAGRMGRPGSWWPGAAGGVMRLAADAGKGRERLADLEAAQAAAEAESQRSERALRLIERMNERIERAARKRRERAAQRRIDELASRKLPLAALALCALLASAPSPLAAADASRDPGLAPILTELRAKQSELERRERELDDRERHAGELEAKAEARLAEAAALVGQLEQRIADFEAAQGDKAMARVARIYGSMPPRAAAALIDRLELELATRIVAKMKPDQSSELLPLLAPERALALSRRVARPLAANVLEKR